MVCYGVKMSKDTAGNINYSTLQRNIFNITFDYDNNLERKLFNGLIINIDY